VLDRVLDDARIAKVLLTRNPLDSYVSRKIASATGQWRLTDLKHAKTGKITFDEVEFVRMLTTGRRFATRCDGVCRPRGRPCFRSGTRTSTISMS
jgi:hypothetical protein